MITWIGKDILKREVPMSPEYRNILTAAMRDGMERFIVVLDGRVCLNLDEIVFEGMLN